jgi:hypothetical protein
MTRVLRDSSLVLIGCLSVALLGMGAAGDDANWRRIRSFPREARLRLAGKLAEFDGLDRPTRDAIRALDAKLAQLPETDRANDLAVLRRYHLWLEGLPESQYNDIAAQPVEKRMALVSRIAAEQTARPRTPSPVVLRYSDFGDFSPYDLADQVKTWSALSPAQRTEIGRYDEAKRQARMTQLARELKVAPVPRPERSELEATFERALKGNLGPFWNARKKDDTPKAARAKLRVMDHLAFLEKPPARVKVDQLAKFAATLPPWVRSLYDPLPPDEARRRLTIVYRLIYPSPAEFVEAKVAAQAKVAAEPKAGPRRSATQPVVPAPGKPAPTTAPF